MVTRPRIDLWYRAAQPPRSAELRAVRSAAPAPHLTSWQAGVLLLACIVLLIPGGQGVIAAAGPSTPSDERFVPLLLPALLNRTGVATGEGRADLDGSGNAYWGKEFPPPGETLSIRGVPFLLQRNAAGADHYVPDTTSITLPSGTVRLYVLGTRTGGSDPGVMQVELEEGETTERPVLLTDWCQSARFGEVEAYASNRRATPSGKDEPQPNSLWAISVELPETARAITFPADKTLHLFALTADRQNPPLWTTPPPRPGFATERVPPLSSPLPPAAPVVGSRHLGFVVHAGQKGREAYAASGSHSMLLNLFMWGMRNREKQLVDFSVAEEWLAHLYRSGLQAAVIIDTSIHHTSVNWRSEATRSRGENLRDQEGKQTPFSSPHSPRYREMVTRYITDLTTWIATHDRERRIRTYVNGAEVFWPGILDHGPLAQARFRDWLTAQYGSLQSVNERWGAEFKSLEEVEPPVFYAHGNGEFGPVTFTYGSHQLASWSTEPAPARGGWRYRVSAEVKADDVAQGLAAAQVVFSSKDQEEAAVVVATTGDTGGKWVRIERMAPAPAHAGQLRLDLTLKGGGRVAWRRVEVTPEFMGENLAPSLRAPSPEVDGSTTAPAGWQFTTSRGQIMGSVSPSPDGKAELVLEGPRPRFPCTHPSAAWHDFVTFSMESYAQTMNHWARTIKAADPTREVMHYAGYLLGTLSQWDNMTLTQFPDVFLSHAPDADINGLQLCAGRGDFHYATVVLDLARKYGKPMVATDLQDFTHGVYVGFNSLNRTSLACVAHGMSGVYYYNWFGTPDYSWFGSWPPHDTARMVSNVAKAAEFLQGAQLQTPAAFVLPILPFSEADPGGQKGDMLDSMGWYKMTVQSGLCPDVYTPYELSRSTSESLRKHRVVIVPDCPFLPVAAARQLWRYVEGGGSLILGGRPPRHDETGRPLPRPFLPSGGVTAAPAGTKRILPLNTTSATVPLRSLPAGVHLPGEATLAGAGGEEWPGFVREKAGAGSITWTGGMDGRAYLGPVRRYAVAGNTPPLLLPDGEWTWPRAEGTPLLDMIRELTAAAHPEEGRLDPPDPRVEMSVHRKGEEVRIMLIHTGPGLHTGGSVVFSSPGAAPATLLADFDPRPIETTASEEGETILSLPDFADSCLIAFKVGGGAP